MKLNKKDILKELETITVPGEGQNMVDSGAVKILRLKTQVCRLKNVLKSTF